MPGLDRKKIETLRKKRFPTMEAAGIAYGFTSQPKQQWNNLVGGADGPPKLETIERLCELLGCSIVDILAADSPAMPRRRQNRRTPSGSAGSIA
jgi:hypothetical protein